MTYWLICRAFDDINTVPLTSTIMCSYEVIGVATTERERDRALREHKGAKAMEIPVIYNPMILPIESIELRDTISEIDDAALGEKPLDAVPV